MTLFKKILSMAMRISISIVLLVFLFKQVDIGSIIGIIKKADKGLILLACGVYFLCYYLAFLRWLKLLKAAKIDLPLKRVVISAAGGVFFSLFLPSTIGGDLVRSVDLAAHTKKTSEVVATVILDRLSGFVGLVSVALFGFFFGRAFVRDRSVVIAIAVITSILVMVILVLFNRSIYAKINQLLKLPEALFAQKKTRTARQHFFDKVRTLLRDTHQEIHYFRNQKRVISTSLMLSFLIQFISPLTFYIIALGLGLHIHPMYFFVFLPIIGAITLLPISIGGLGLRDASIVYFFAQAGVARDLAFAMSLLNFFFIVLYAAIGGIIYVLTVHHRRV